MHTLALHFEFSGDPPPDDPDMSRFRRRLSSTLEEALKAAGSGRWRGGRYARGVVTIFLEVADTTPSVMTRVQTVLSAQGLRAKMTIHCNFQLPWRGDGCTESARWIVDGAHRRYVL